MVSAITAHEVGDGLSIVIIHGWQMNHTVEQADFEPIFKQVPGFLRIYLDLPGHGTTLADNVHDLDEMYHRVVRFLDTRFTEDQRFLLAGSSCGALFARALAQKFGNRVDGLLLRVPLIEPDNNKRDIDPFTPLVRNERLVKETLSIKQKADLGNILVQTPSYIHALLSKFRSTYLPAVESADNTVLDLIRNDPARYKLSTSVLDETIKFHAPTLILCGRQDDVVGYRDAVRLLEVYPRATFAVLDRGTHDFPVDGGDMEMFRGQTADWLGRVKEWRADR